jgi:Zn-dependent protease
VLVTLAVVIPSIILHEVAHGVVAGWFGDDTARRAGRITLNPVAHVDPFGTVLLPLLMAATGFGVFGYAKPVPINPSRMRSPRNNALVVSLAGPATNILLALACTLVFRLTRPSTPIYSLDGLFQQSLVVQLAFFGGLMNVLLAVFNLLPIPPLDGSALLERVMPRSWWPTYARFRQYSMFLLLGVVLLAPRLLNPVFDRAINWWSRLL